jgi:hypothetical protein
MFFSPNSGPASLMPMKSNFATAVPARRPRAQNERKATILRTFQAVKRSVTRSRCHCGEFFGSYYLCARISSSNDAELHLRSISRRTTLELLYVSRQLGRRYRLKQGSLIRLSCVTIYFSHAIQGLNTIQPKIFRILLC